MRGEPASARSGAASFDLIVGSALKAILPGAFQGAVIGAIAYAAYFTMVYAAGLELVSAVMLFCFAVLAGTMAGTVLCAVYLTLVGLPLALVMRRRIGTWAMLAVSLAAACVFAALASRMIVAQAQLVGAEAIATYAAALAFTVPAAVTYRRAIMVERLLNL